MIFNGGLDGETGVTWIKATIKRDLASITAEKELERRYEGLTVIEKLKLLKQDIKESAKMTRSIQSTQRRQEQHQEPVRKLDYIFDFDCPTADGFPRVIFPFQGSNMQFSGDFELKFWIFKRRKEGTMQRRHLNKDYLSFQ